MKPDAHSLEQTDRTITQTLAHVSVPLLRITLGTVYLWFGALKVAGVSPVADFVGRTLPFFPQQVVVRVLGLWEILIGLSLVFRVALRPSLVLFAAQIVGTFLSFVMQPHRMVKRGNPLCLTMEGEFVLKNIVLLAAGMVVGSTVRRTSESLHANTPAERE